VPSRLELTRQEILAFRRRAGGLDERLPAGAQSLRRAAWGGLQDSMPRAALLSLYARVEAVEPSSWEDPSLAQLWGPRYSVYVVAKADFAVFSLGRFPDSAKNRDRAVRVAEQLHAHLDGARMLDREVGRALGVNPNVFRYAAPTGTVAIRWDGARPPVVWTVPAPDVDPADARRELVRRYLHVFGPSTAERFAAWAGLRRPPVDTFDALEAELLPVRSPLGDEWLLGDDEAAMRTEPAAPAPARLLPSGDAYFLLQGAERELLVPDADRRARLWTPRVWPGALLVDGEIRGTWRRAQHTVRVDAWEDLSPAARDAVEAEARALPLPGLGRPIEAVWEDRPEP
jgi:Winged helix DNA-binding domain